MTTTQAKDFDEAVALIQAGRCPNDGGALTPMSQRSGYGQCATCRLGWSAHVSNSGRAIGQFTGGRHYTWFPTGTGRSRGDIGVGDSQREMPLWVAPSRDLVPWLVAAARETR
jgi:hypothetical protein